MCRIETSSVDLRGAGTLLTTLESTAEVGSYIFIWFQDCSLQIDKEPTNITQYTVQVGHVPSMEKVIELNVVLEGTTADEFSAISCIEEHQRHMQFRFWFQVSRRSL